VHFSGIIADNTKIPLIQAVDLSKLQLRGPQLSVDNSTVVIVGDAGFKLSHFDSFCQLVALSRRETGGIKRVPERYELSHKINTIRNGSYVISAILGRTSAVQTFSCFKRKNQMSTALGSVQISF
jgi:hypothetical protein